MLAVANAPAAPFARAKFRTILIKPVDGISELITVSRWDHQSHRFTIVFKQPSSKSVAPVKNMSVLKAIKETLFGDGASGRRDEVRVITARYNIGNKRDPGETERRFFVCRIEEITDQALSLIHI